ncbi:MAG TPA: hypothetical protein VND93_22050, partial [Myxococcales bacterium]|nr:hypothetical protein [Myxococcales bacterium]
TAGGIALSSSDANTMLFMLPLELEHAITANLSVSGMVTPTYAMNGPRGAIGLGLNGGARLYPFGRAPDGLWLGGQLMTTLLMTSSGPTADIDLQPQVGYQWVFGNGLTLGVGAGLSVAALVAGHPPLTIQIPIGFAW